MLLLAWNVKSLVILAPWDLHLEKELHHPRSRIVIVDHRLFIDERGAATSAEEFNAEELFSERRITLAPMVVLLGYVVVGVAIMYREKK